MKSFAAVAATLFSLGAVVLARPMDVYAPKVTSPDSDSIWSAGKNYTITWDASSPPKQITNPIGHIILRANGVSWTNTTLAKGFNITDGTVQVTAPDVPTGTHYSVVLFGDSGNWSPDFTIFGSDNSDGSDGSGLELSADASS
ncbi:hypothetical protein CONPUDRAFT_85739 [Coniophora puteana RWD-64-598 SS2]|uniref:Yeast cell wall synthesis Kre9/Knh1-like N-terminal domain-containing protein n=1 Tax=Coniophora puteana (strain RWD-64-598) TaxID=741705 RepID=R7SHL2_CONPW|nr:uncharacterized protein CONPUDRAFT_85739 [Coniophora puteana RWD-64-598 SS2]EIW74559.1 hypothetical protein CONPUDRAFT_85739 [Coniophora puteana RWD-64-598 SS2]